jgi:hypothetical protein
MLLGVNAFAMGDISWFREAKYGINILYQYGYGADPPSYGTYHSSEQWNYMIDNFDVEAFADQLVQCGAGYVQFFVTSRHTSYTAAPSSVFDSITGSKAGELCSRRDLVMDMSEAFLKRGLRIILAGMISEYDGGGAMNWSRVKKMGTGTTLRNNRIKMMEEFAARYGVRVSGWWIYSHEFAGHTAVNTDAVRMLRKYNPDAIVAIGRSNKRSEWFKRWSAEQDFTNAECWQIDPNVTPEKAPAPSGMQWQLNFFLDKKIYGGNDGVKYETDYLVNYVDKCTSQGGVLTIDVGFSYDGTIWKPHFEQLLAVKDSVKGTVAICEPLRIRKVSAIAIPVVAISPQHPSTTLLGRRVCNIAGQLMHFPAYRKQATSVTLSVIADR